MRILVLAPHTDDGEMYCGGSISRFVEEDNDVHCAAFSIAVESLPEGFPADTLVKEIREAVDVLGVHKDNLVLYDYEVRHFLRFRQEILEDMVRLCRDIKPDLVFLPSTYDMHQDHQVISNEGFRAFKSVSILGYEVPRNNLSFNAGAFISLKERHLTRKLKAVSCYVSQSAKLTMTEEYIKSLAISRGVQIGVEYAEAFEVIRWII